VTRFHLTFRRVLVVAASLLIGAGGAVAVGAPASADPVSDPFTVTVAGEAGCTDDGTRKIAWTVTNGHPDMKLAITWVGDGTGTHTLENPKTVGDIKRLAEIPAGGSLSGDEVIAEDDTRAVAKLIIGAAWTKDEADNRETFAEVQLAGLESCAPPCVTADQAEYVHTFDAAAGTATVALKGKGALCADVVLHHFRLVRAAAVPARLRHQVDHADGERDRAEGGAAQLLPPDRPGVG
jgi:hypothetical protein